jgi:cell division protein ZapD
VETIIDILAVMSRQDLRKELLKELERQAATLEGLGRNPNVDQGRLEAVLIKVRGVLDSLYGADTTSLGQELRENELLSGVRQRIAIPAGTCPFDLPAYYHWLQSPAERRLADLDDWLSTFDRLRDAVSLCLELVRESAVATRETAHAGFFQKTLETSTPCQMVRVSVPGDFGSFPEISGGKHRFTVRFMEAVPGGRRPVQHSEDVEFELLCCMI